MSWILSTVLRNLSTQYLIWLSTVMVINSVLAFLFGSDEDHFGTTYGKHMRGIPSISLAGYNHKVLKVKMKRMRKYEVLEKGKIFGLDDRQLHIFNGLVRLASYHFGISWCNSRNRLKQCWLGKSPLSILVCSCHLFLLLCNSDMLEGNGDYHALELITLAATICYNDPTYLGNGSVQWITFN